MNILVAMAFSLAIWFSPSLAYSILNGDALSANDTECAVETEVMHPVAKTFNHFGYTLEDK